VKFLRILVVLAVLIAVSIHFGWLQVTFYAYWTSPSDAAASSTGPSRDVEDVRALRDAAAGGSASAPVAVYRLLDRAAELGPRPGARLVERRLPALAARVEREFPVVQDRLRSLGIQTQVGWSCREAALRLLVRERRLFRTLAADVAGTEPTWRAVDRFGARVAALHRWYASNLRSSCLAQASSHDRAAVRHAMYQF
jgi:hypothetical protein